MMVVGALRRLEAALERRFLNHWSGGRVSRRWVLAVTAVLIGLMVMLWPSTLSEGFGWGFDGEVPAGQPAVTFQLDTVTGTISSSQTSEVLSFPHGIAFSMSGVNGDGWLTVEATDPNGNVVVRRDIPPQGAFWIPADGTDADEALYSSPFEVTLEINPIDVVHPNDVAHGRLTLVNNSLDEAATVTQFGVEGWIADAPWSLVSEVADSCGGLATQLPLALVPLTSTTCTFDITGSPTLGPGFVGVATLEEHPGIVFSSEPLLLAFTDVAPRQQTTYPAPPPALDPPDTLEAQIDAEMRTDVVGTYVVSVSSPTGSRHVSFNINGTDTRLVLPVSEHFLSWIGLVWLGAGLSVAANGLGPVSGSLLLGSGAVIPVALLVTGEHIWYWVVPTGALAIAAIAAAGIGAALIVPAGDSRFRSGAGTVLAGLCILLAVAAAGSSAVYDPMNPPYHGDYMIMGFHLLLMSSGVAVAAIGGALIGHPANAAHIPRDEPSSNHPEQDRANVRATAEHASETPFPHPWRRVLRRRLSVGPAFTDIEASLAPPHGMCASRRIASVMFRASSSMTKRTPDLRFESHGNPME